MKIILIGMKMSGKSTVGQSLAKKLGINFIEMDNNIESMHNKMKHENLTAGEIYKEYGEEYFRTLEMKALKMLSINIPYENYVLSCGGGTPLRADNREILAKLGKIIFINADRQILLKRIRENGIPQFFPNKKNPEKSLEEIMKKRLPIYENLADLTVYSNQESADKTADLILDKIKKYEN